MTRKFLFSIVFLSLISLLGLDAQQKCTVQVTLKDSLTREPVSYATVYVSKDGTTKRAYYAMANDKGVGIVTGVPDGTYYLVAEMMGYTRVTRKIEVKGAKVNVGEILMHEDIEMLEAAVVSAVGNPIVAKQDTIEYTASSFKTTDNDMLEDLLKKLPGIEVDSDGNITANGETITKIMIDGKEFFMDDPSLASKNIPANIIQKVKVVDKKSDQAEFTGIDDGNEQKVIDLQVKPGLLESWFGNVSAGGGHDLASSTHDARYQASGILGRFTTDNQISIILNGNNTNNRGFSDMMSGMGGGMRGMGGGSGGITTSWMAGINANMNIKGDRNRELGGNYMYNGSTKDVEESSARTTFMNDGSSLFSNNLQTSHYFSDGHRGGIEFDYKFSDKTSLLFRPSFNYGRSSYQEQREFSTDNSVSGKINDGMSESRSDGTSWKTGGRILLRQKVGQKTGRTFSLNVDYNISSSDFNGINRSLTNSYMDGIMTDAALVDQHYDQKDNSYSVAADMTYTEPLGKNFFLLGSYRVNWKKTESEKLTYDEGETDPNVDYSSIVNNSYLNHRMQLTLMKQEKKYNLQVGFNAQPSTTSTKASLGASRDTTYTVWNFAPSARFDYRFSKSESLRINYNGRSSEPTINQLMPIPDNSNPLYVSLGNTSLRPEFRHDMHIDYRYTDMESFSTFSLRGGASYVKDDIINANWYDASGVQYSAPVNSTAPTLSGNVMFMMNLQFGKSGFSLMSHTRSSVSSGVSFTGQSTTATTLEDAMDSLVSNRTTSLTVSENLTFVYRKENIEARLGGRANFNKAWYQIATQARSNTWTNSVFADVIWTMPWGMELRTDANYRYYIGYEAGYGEPTLTWNAEISQLLLKKKMTLRFKVYDILNQSKNNYRTTTDNYIEDVYNNTLGQYFMVSLVYRFGNNDAMRGGRRGGGRPPHR